MTPQQVLSLLSLLADLQAKVSALTAENAELRRQLEQPDT